MIDETIIENEKIENRHFIEKEEQKCQMDKMVAEAAEAIVENEKIENRHFTEK